MPNKSRKAKRETLKKEGVEMTMKFRNHQDPLYYDPKANDKVFVPVVPEVSKLTSTALKANKLMSCHTCRAS